jgi:transposase
LTKILSRLIQISSLAFIDSEDTIICDSTWLGHHMYHGGYHLVYDKEHCALDKCTKVHIACLKNSKAIAFAKVTEGTVHDSPMLKELVMNVINNGFNIKNLLADAGYSSKANYSFCNHVNISNVFIDFQERAKLRPDGRTPWMKQLKVFKENPDVWHEKYRYRVVVEGIFSCIKKKHVNYLRSRQTDSRFNELLLKILVHNLTVIGRYF